MKRVAVVGGGPAGLAAALELGLGGAEVELFEASDRPGGALRTEEMDGALVDVGVQLASSTHDTLFGLLRDCGAGEVLQRSPGHDALWRKDRAHGITYGSVSSMVASGALPTTLKLRLGAKYLPFLSSRAQGLDANDPAATGGVALDDESIAAWGKRELGEDFVELLVYPLLAAYYGALPEETGAATYHALAKVGMDVQVYGARGGFGEVAAALVRGIESRGGRVHTMRRVSSVEWGPDDVAIDGDRFDAAVLAVPPQAAAALLRSGGDDAGSGMALWLDGVRTRDAFTLALRLDREVPADWFGLSFPRVTTPGERVAVMCVQRHKLPGLVSGGDAVVAIPSPQAAEALFGASDQVIADTLMADMDGAVKGLARRVTATRVTRFPDGYSLFPPGHLQRLRSLDPALLPSRMALAGDYLVAPSVEGALRSGSRAARRVLAGTG